MIRPPAQGAFILLGPDRGRWPEPLGTSVEMGECIIEPTLHLHDMAAGLAMHRRIPIRAVLLDPTVLTACDLHFLATLMRHVSIPVITLPVTAEASPAIRHAAGLGILTWEEASSFFTGVTHEESPAASVAGDSETAETDNSNLVSIETSGENPVTSEVEARYDDFGTQPLLTDQEVRALLGTPE
jgi:hypothetical protein